MCRTACPTPGQHKAWCVQTPLPERSAYYADLRSRGMWRCKDCDKELPLGAFYIRKSGKDRGKPTAARCRAHVLAADSRTDWKYNTDYAAMLASQGGRCAICGTAEPRGKGKFHVDHDHSCCGEKRSCGKCVRGLLCQRCNTGIGYFDDNPDLMRKAIEYVSR